MDSQKQKQISKEWHEAFGTAALKNNYDKYLHDNFVADFFGGRQVNKAQYIEQDQQFALAFEDIKITVVETNCRRKQGCFDNDVDRHPDSRPTRYPSNRQVL